MIFFIRHSQLNKVKHKVNLSYKLVISRTRHYPRNLNKEFYLGYKIYYIYHYKINTFNLIRLYKYNFLLLLLNNYFSISKINLLA